MGIWKYFPAHMQSQIPKDLYKKIKVRWDLTMQSVKNIFEQQLRLLVPNLTDEEVKKALLDNEDRMILMLNTCFILTNNKESVISQASSVWRTLYHLNQPSIEAIEIKDDDNNDNEEDESNNILVTQSELLEVMKGEEEDKEEEALEVMEINDMVRIASKAIASLSHSPPNTITLVESASTGEIASSTPSTS